jgi:hypothetical protein
VPLTTYRHKLSPKHLKLPSRYRTTAWAEVVLPQEDGHGVFLEVARFHSSTPGHVEIFAKQDGAGNVTEISETEFFRLVTPNRMTSTSVS